MELLESVLTMHRLQCIDHNRLEKKSDPVNRRETRTSAAAGVPLTYACCGHNVTVHRDLGGFTF